MPGSILSSLINISHPSKGWVGGFREAKQLAQGHPGGARDQGQAGWLRVQHGEHFGCMSSFLAQSAGALGAPAETGPILEDFGEKSMPAA